MNKKIAVAALATSIVLFGSVPAMASGNVVRITHNMFKTYQAPTVVQVPALVQASTVTTESSEISLKGLFHSYVGSVSVVRPAAQPAPAPLVPPATTGIATAMTADEQEMVDLINQDRERNGLPALKVDLRLVTAAREKSQDLITNNYFSHFSPVFGYTSSLLPGLGLNTQYVSENVAGNRSVSAAESALEGDIPHQQNILDSNINFVGVGIVYGGPYGGMYTQEFARE